MTTIRGLHRGRREVVVGYPSGQPFDGRQGQVLEDVISGTGTGVCLCRIRVTAGGISYPHTHNESPAALVCTHGAKQGVWTLWGWKFEHATQLFEGGGKVIAMGVPHICVMPLDDIPAEEDVLHSGHTEVYETRWVDSTQEDIEQLPELWELALSAIREREIPISEVQKFVPTSLAGSLAGMSRGLWYPRFSPD